jgi:hypothetical protein
LEIYTTHRLNDRIRLTEKIAQRTGTKEQDNQTRREKHKPLWPATALHTSTPPH